MFDIDWNKPQISSSLPSGNLAVYNANTAASRGFELESTGPLFVPRLSYSIGYAYADDSALKFVEISNPALHYTARVFYIDPQVQVGQAVALGQPIGVHHTLEQKYPGGMTDHVHLEIIDNRGERIDATVKDGVLRLTVSKAADTAAKKISVKAE